jgi:hypothetical protein
MQESKIHTDTVEALELLEVVDGPSELMLQVACLRMQLFPLDPTKIVPDYC